MTYLYIKALHIIFVTTWFAGLFYIVRLFVYHAEAQQKPEPEKSILISQYQLMQRRLWYIITIPSMLITVLLGTTLLYLVPNYLHQGWMHVKLLMIVLLLAYQWYCHKLFTDFQHNRSTKSSSFFRIWNEVATLLLFAIVFLVVLKDSLSWIYGVIGLVSLSIILMIGIKMYKKNRTKNLNQ